MSREVAFDFEKFRDFFQSYSLSGFDRNTQLLDNLSQLHKKYFAFLTLSLSYNIKRRIQVGEFLLLLQIIS